MKDAQMLNEIDETGLFTPQKIFGLNLTLTVPRQTERSGGQKGLGLGKGIAARKTEQIRQNQIFEQVP